MAIKKIEIQDYEGNKFYPHTSSDVILHDTRTVEKILNEVELEINSLSDKSVVSVVDFGAKGDGKTNDTTAIRNAINKCYQLGGGEVIFPKGVFLVSSTITIPAGVVLVGKSAVKYTQVQDSNLSGDNGTIIKPNSDFDVFVFDRASNFAGIKRLSIHYPNIDFSSTSTPSTHSAIKFTTARNDAEYTENVIIEEIDITGFQCGIYMPWIKGESLNYAQYYYTVFRNISIAKCKCGMFLNGMSDIVVDNILCKDLFGMNLAKIYPYTCPMVNDLSFMSNVWAEKSMNLINDLGNSQINKYAIYGGGGHGMVLQDCVAIHYDRGVCASIDNYAGLVLRGCTTKSRIYGLRSALNKAGVLLLASEYCRNTRVDFISCRIENNFENGVIFKIANGQKSDYINFTSCDISNNSLYNPGIYEGVLSENSSDLKFVSCFLGDDQVEHSQKIPFYGTTNRTKFIGCDLSGTSFSALPLGEDNEFIACVDAPVNLVDNVAIVPTSIPITPAIPESDVYLRNDNNVSVKIHFKRGNITYATIKHKDGGEVGLPFYINAIDLAPGESIKFAGDIPTEWIWLYSCSNCYTKL